jgi:lysozyme
MKTSPQGEKALELEEGVVLRAYRDVAGVWTIGPGLTAASGVVVPKAGMVITRDEATALLRAALPKYEARVSKYMPGANQHEIDAAVSFDWNTGAIDRAKWVVFWRARANSNSIRASLMTWCHGGGKVLPGLEARRAREARMLLDGVYRTDAAPSSTPFAYADWGVRLSPEEMAAAIKGFQDLGYEIGRQPGAILRFSARKFQADYGLTVDGIIGRATLSTVQRQLDARAKVKTTTAVAAAPIAAAAVPQGSVELIDQLMSVPHAPAVLIAFGLAYAAAQAFHYRDAVAALPFIPARLGAFLRSF